MEQEARWPSHNLSRTAISQVLLSYCTTGACSGPLKTCTFNKQLNEWLKGTNKLLRLCSNQCLCFYPHQRPQSVWYSAPTPWSEPRTGRREEQSIEKREGHVVASFSPSLRVVDPDEGTGHVSYSPGCYCFLHPITRHVIYLFIYLLAVITK